MKRLMFLLLAALLLAPAMVAAQEADAPSGIEEVTVQFGEGWTWAYTAEPFLPDQDWDHRFAFFGPRGSRVLIMTYSIGSSISERGREWAQLKRILPNYAGQPALMADINEEIGNSDPETIPESVSDSYRSSYLDPYGEEFAFGLFAFTGSPTAVIILVEGTVNGLTGVAATDYVAGLYFAALSGQ